MLISTDVRRPPASGLSWAKGGVGVKRSLGVLAAVCGVAMVLSACGGGEESQSAPPESPAASTPSSDPSVSVDETPVETPSESPETSEPEPEPEPEPPPKDWIGLPAAFSMVDEILAALPPEWEAESRSGDGPEAFNFPELKSRGVYKPEKCSYAFMFFDTGQVLEASQGVFIQLETVDESVELGIAVNNLDGIPLRETYTFFDAMSACNKVAWGWDQSKPKTNPPPSVADSVRDTILWDTSEATIENSGNTWTLPADWQFDFKLNGEKKPTGTRQSLHHVNMSMNTEVETLVDVYYDRMADSDDPKPKVVTEEAFLSVLPTINEIVASYMGDAQ